MQLMVMWPLVLGHGGDATSRASLRTESIPMVHIKGSKRDGAAEQGRKGEDKWGEGGRSAASRVVSLHSSFICRFIKSRANFDIISFKQLHLAGVWNLFEIKKTITERQQSSKTTSET